MKTIIVTGSDEDVKQFHNKKLIRNSVRCKRCGDIIESKSTHHAVRCSCKFTTVDGGLSYTRVMGDLDNIEYLHQWLVETE